MFVIIWLRVYLEIYVIYVLKTNLHVFEKKQKDNFYKKEI
jgi:hypothetical protein